MVIKKTEAIEMIDGVKAGTIIHATTKEGMKNIPMVTGIGTGFFITGLTGATEINNAAASLNEKFDTSPITPAFMRVL